MQTKVCSIFLLSQNRYVFSFHSKLDINLVASATYRAEQPHIVLHFGHPELVELLRRRDPTIALLGAAAQFDSTQNDNRRKSARHSRAGSQNAIYRSPSGEYRFRAQRETCPPLPLNSVRLRWTNARFRTPKNVGGGVIFLPKNNC